MPSLLAADPLVPPLPVRIEARHVASFADRTGDWIRDNSEQLIAGAIAAAVVAGLLLGLRSLGHRLARRGAGPGAPGRATGRALTKLRLWFVLAAALQVVAAYAHPPSDVARTVGFLFVVAAALQAAICARELAIALVEGRAAATDSVQLHTALSLIRGVLTFAVFAVAVIVILDNVGVNVTGLVAGLGIGGVAIGLAAQGIFADLFAALAIIFDRPFRKGDAIRWGGATGTTGTVEDIGMKSTRVRALTGELVVIANKQLLDKEIQNFARLERRRVVTPFTLRPSSLPERLAELPTALREVVEGCGAELVRGSVNGFSGERIDCELQYDVHTEDWNQVVATQTRVNVALVARLRELGLHLGGEAPAAPPL